MQPARSAPAAIGRSLRLTENLDSYFVPGSPLQDQLQGFAPRPGQLEMARLVFRAMRDRRHLAVEAGAGTGKTLAYLVPALLSGLRVIVATGTRTLQDQLYHRDLPAIGRAIGRPVKVAQLKGRANYLCIYRLRFTLEAPERGSAGRRGELQALQSWSLRTRSGDIGEAAGVAEDSDLWPAVTSTADNCLGARCPSVADCHVAKARKTAAEADIAVVNHHLLLADMTLREEGFGSLLPGADVVIVDEAHRFPDVAQGLFDVTLSGRQIGELLRDVRGEATRAGVLSATLERSLAAVADQLQQVGGPVRPDSEPVSLAAAGEEQTARLRSLAEALETLHEDIAGLHEAAPGLARCHERLAMRAAAAGRIAAWQDESDLCWLQPAAQGFAVHLTPLDAARQLCGLMESQPCTWIFTSATLAVRDDFAHFTNRVGLRPIATHRIESPYDFPTCTRLYLPRDLPEPDAPDYTQRFVATVAPVLAASRGRAFLLFTSRRALRRAAELLADADAGYTLLVQGQAPRPRLLEQFAKADRAVLLGTATFWEGVDIRGQALVVVAIDRLPFASPADPLLQARMELIRRNGGEPFRDYQLPQAVLTLRQGVGRLIRGDDDYGVVVICDPRLRRRGYGRVFMSSLPPMPVIEDIAEVEAFIAEKEHATA
jgi:ATP-dependent DNA helicase DinG